MKKMLFMTLAFVFTFCLGLSKVYATEISVDDGNKIAMPVLLYNDSDEQLTLKGLDGATLYYQIVDVSNNTEIVNYIDENIVGKLNNLAEKEIEFSKYESGTNESINLNNDIQFVKESIDEAVKSEKLKTFREICFFF